MIDLTPLEVRKKKGDFRQAIRGYERGLVDDFLDLVADRLEALVRENLALAERVTRLEREVVAYREKERLLNEALVSAQEMRGEMRRHSESEARLVRREAEAEAAKIRQDAEVARQREEEALRLLRARRAQFVRSYRTFLERELGELTVVSQRLALEEARPPSAAEGGMTQAAGAVLPPGEEGTEAELEAEIDVVLAAFDEEDEEEAQSESPSRRRKRGGA